MTGTCRRRLKKILLLARPSSFIALHKAWVEPSRSCTTNNLQIYYHRSLEMSLRSRDKTKVPGSEQHHRKPWKDLKTRLYYLAGSM